MKGRRSDANRRHKTDGYCKTLVAGDVRSMGSIRRHRKGLEYSDRYAIRALSTEDDVMCHDLRTMHAEAAVPLRRVDAPSPGGGCSGATDPQRT